MILSDDGLILLKVAENGIQNGTFAIPDSVTHIGNGAFARCGGLTIIKVALIKTDHWIPLSRFQ